MSNFETMNSSAAPNRLEAMALAAAVLNVFQMMLCPVYSAMVHILSVNPNAFQSMHAKPPLASEMYAKYGIILLVLVPLAFGFLSLLLIRLNAHVTNRLFVAAAITGYFLCATLFAFEAAALPLLELEKQLR